MGTRNNTIGNYGDRKKTSLSLPLLYQGRGLTRGFLLLYWMFQLSQPVSIALTPSQVSLEQMYDGAEFVVQGEIIKMTDWSLSAQCKYRALTVRVDREYKGNAMCDFSVFDTIPPGQPCIHIQLSLSGTFYDEDLKKGSSYIFFLDPPMESFLYPFWGFDVWGPARPVSADIISVLEKCQKTQREENRKMRELPLPKGFTSTMPKNSLPRKKEARAGQKDPDPLLHVEYWLNDEKLGERTWDAGKRFRSEILFRNGLLDGIMQTWSAGGQPVRAVPFREGKVHGPVKEWSASGDIKTTFWIEGRQVSQEVYEKDSEKPAEAKPKGSQEAVTHNRGRVGRWRGGCRKGESLLPAAFAAQPVPQSLP